MNIITLARYPASETPGAVTGPGVSSPAALIMHAVYWSKGLPASGVKSTY